MVLNPIGALPVTLLTVKVGAKSKLTPVLPMFLAVLGFGTSINCGDLISVSKPLTYALPGDT